MKKYIGGKMVLVLSIFAALLGIVLPIVMLIITINPFSIDALPIMLLCILCIIVWGFYLKKISNQFYSWVYFYEDKLCIKTIFSKPIELYYNKCSKIGIGYYTHGILNTRVGTKIYYIFFSYDAFDEKYRQNLNLWVPSSTQTKVGFRKDIYDYLISVLPKSQALILKNEYKMFIENK